MLISTGIFPPDIGGPATFVPRIAAALLERGHPVTVLTLGEGGRGEPAYPFPVLRLPRRAPLPWRMPLTASRLATAAGGVDAIFANGLFEETAVAAALTGRPWAAKVVGDWVWERAFNQGRTDQEIGAFQSDPPASMRPHRAAQRWAIRRARCVVVPSAYVGGIAAGWGVDRRRLVVIPNAVEAAGPTDRAAAKRRLGLEGWVLLSAGRLVRWKHVDGILRAAAGLPLEVVVAGDGPERPILERLASTLGRPVRFTGALPPSELAVYYSAADLFVLNSTYEGFPHVALEAMAAGAVVVAAAAGGTPEVVVHGRTGLLVAPRNETELRAALRGLLGDEGRRRELGAAGRAWATQFSWGGLVQRYIAVLDDLVRERNEQGASGAMKKSRSGQR